jgi:thioredoxin-related protein
LIKKGILLILAIFNSNLNANASYEKGLEIFFKKCSSCHSKYIDMKDLKINFFEKKNKLFNLTSPTVNMLAYAMIDSPKHLGSKDDPEMQQIEIEEFLKNYLEKPDLSNSICEDSIIKYYDKKLSVDYKLNDEDISNLAIYFMNYKKERLKKKPKKIRLLTNNFNEEDLLKEARESKKKIFVYATSKTCHFCKKMDKEVLSLNDVVREIEKDFIFLKVDIEDVSLPFNLSKGYRGMTPTFFALDNEGKLKNKYPGSWNKKDFLTILEENKK